MPGCSAVNCSNRAPKFKLHRFPSDEARKKIWAIKVNRLDENDKLWIPGKHAVLCEAHFEKDQYENHRKDGRRLLKRDAVPTLFSHRPAPKRRRCSGSKTGHRNNCEHIDPTLDHSYAANLFPMTSMQPSTENDDDCQSTNGDEDNETSGPIFQDSKNDDDCQSTNGDKDNEISGPIFQDSSNHVSQPLSPKSKQINELKSQLQNALHRVKSAEK
ncbi:THAP domain-containing protein 4-like [Centruroides sculpturatus]|uniref:THAP domain-containing protein 4-like n=1 Tax=Centruroides sculpturatus TaxID=218467 RepID=UPI000C6EA27B|nr:THAP domain-containing protein 4-like [Centruroides sculpturatus]